MNGVGELWRDALSSVGNVLGEKLSGDGVRFQKLSLLSWSLFVHILVWHVRVEGDDVVGESSVG